MMDQNTQQWATRIRRVMTAVLIAVLLPLLFAACLFQPQQPTNHYFIEVPFDEQASLLDPPSSGIEARVLFAEVDPIYNRRQIIQRTTPRSAVFLIRQLWAEDLSESVSRLIADVLIIEDVDAETGIVPGRSWNVQPYLRRLEHVLADNGPQAYIDLDLVVTSPGDNSRTFRHRDVLPLENRDLDTFAAQITTAIREYADELAGYIREQSASGEGGNGG